MTKVYLSLGSNIGDRKSYLDRAIKSLNNLEETTVTTVSSFYETPAWGKTDQADFLNCCCELETQLVPQALLSACQKIEKDLNRVRHEHWGPRTIDIDILLFGDGVINEENLKIPHPYMLERTFVLVPLEEIAPDLIFGGNTISYYRKLLDYEQVKKITV